MARSAIPNHDGESTGPRRVADGRAPAVINEKAIAALASTCKLLADHTRLRILYHLSDCQELHVQALCELLHESQPAVSHHLGLLRTAAIIIRRRQGKHNYYRLQLEQFVALLDLLFAELPATQDHLRLGMYRVTREKPAMPGQ